MPVYPATLQHMPIPMAESIVLSNGRQLKSTLQIVHSKNYGHNNVKAANVSISSIGKQQLIACTCSKFFVYGYKPVPNQQKLTCSTACVSLVHAGDCIPGNFGSALPLGQHTREHTPTHWPAEFENTDMSFYETSFAVDFFQLTVTLLERTGCLVLTDNPTPAKCQESISRLQNPALSGCVSELLQPQD